jgi:energy-coupling factor transporter ATP-binding protein EcfA2
MCCYRMSEKEFFSPEDLKGLPADTEIWSTPYEVALTKCTRFRKRWFYLLQVTHREFERVLGDLLELMDPHNEVKIVSVIGMTGIGKTTLANEIAPILEGIYGPPDGPDQCPVLHVSAPANGERLLSWRALYRNALNAGHEPGLEHKRRSEVVNGKLVAVKGGGKSTADLRWYLEQMLRERKVKALIIDEALHLLRFNDYSTIMDTLKSLADCGEAKLMLIGTHQIADLMTEYGQVVRRSEIIHYKRYMQGPRLDAPDTDDEREYFAQLEKFQENWPCKDRPRLTAIWRVFMRDSLGSIGLTKSILLRLLVLQLAAPDERLQKEFFKKALKGNKSLKILEAETVEGEARLVGACYGDGQLSADELVAVMGE